MEKISLSQKDKLSSYHKLRSLFEQNIHVGSIAEPLATCNVLDDALQVKNKMIDYDYDVIGMEESGVVIGYLMRDEIKEGICKDYYRYFSPTELVADSTALITTLLIFKEIDRIFVLEGNRVTKVVTLADLQKPPIRMLLFGLISLLEMHLVRLINYYLPNDTWKKYLQTNRIEAAEKLFMGRKARNEAIELSDCLQICDKRDIVIHDETLRNHLHIESKSKGKDFFKKLEGLRNNLAHSQDLNTQNSWNEIFTIIEQTEEILEICEQI
ncbi:hypothetical protein [Neobacillus kokaensis]|uniref:CBS domain-containing protein n=1 Tax=Neobacillus kokaensis TaxID=2759023 RepID=A0ABQ3N993_9BACI|nr:hypothetical protein [Neobacillus kokaensis]GHI00328.1 hypothetical protein AM1BK_38700 [Neobacillus kokaensis]